MTWCAYAVARVYARTSDPNLKRDIERYRELEAAPQLPQQGMLFAEKHPEDEHEETTR